MPAARPTILLIGLGHLGGVVLESLARANWIGRLVAWSRNPATGEARCNLARLGAIAQGCLPELEYRAVDLSRTEECAQALDTLKPDLVLGTASLETWWLPDLLPAPARERLSRARFGVWLPFHLLPTLWLMQAIRQSSFRGPVITAPFPDVVNRVLGRMELAPTCGTGNLDEIATKVRWLAAQRLRAPVESVRVSMVGHHALEAAAFAGRQQGVPPYFLRILYRGDDVTDALAGDEILFEPHPLPSGPGIAFFTAGSTYRLVRALLTGEPTLIHVPGPNGLPGGYPVVVSDHRVEIDLPDGLNLDQAVSINERSQPFDGIESIEADGTAVFRSDSVEIMRQELGYDCPRLAPADALERSRELAMKFRAYAQRHAVDLELFS